MLKTVSSITNAIGALNYKGTWNASTNTPTITSSVGTKGDYYVVSVAGTTNINGISNWGVGDWIVFNGVVWQRVEGGADLNGVNVSFTGTASGPTYETSNAAAGLTITDNDITADGTDTNIDIDITPKGTGEVNLPKVDIDGGAIDGTAIGAGSASTGAFTTLSASSTTTLSNLTASTALALDGSKNVVSVTNTGSGNNVLATSPTLGGNVAITQTPGAYTIDVTGGATSIANSGTVDFANASGMLLVNDHRLGWQSLFIAGGGGVQLVSSVGGSNNVTFAYNAGINGYRFTNVSGFTATFGFFFVRTRTNG